MKVVCQKRRRSDLALEACKPYAPEVAYELQIGGTYTVYGQYLAEGCLYYLIDAVDRQGLSHPTWYPAGLFRVEDGSIPSSWSFAYRLQHEEDGVTAMWGYSELLQDAHFEGLQERKEDDMLLWLHRKEEIDQAEGSDWT